MSERGFSLPEAIVATAIVGVALTSLAQLFVIATDTNHRARSTTVAAILAQQKIEQLRGLAWSLDSTGSPVTDTTADATTAPEQPTGGAGLSPSPADSLEVNREGYCDFLNETGRPLGSGIATPLNTAYIRRWRVAPAGPNPSATVLLHVRVVPWTKQVAASSARNIHVPGEVRLVSAKVRKSW